MGRLGVIRGFDQGSMRALPGRLFRFDRHELNLNFRKLIFSVDFNEFILCSYPEPIPADEKKWVNYVLSR